MWLKTEISVWFAWNKIYVEAHPVCFLATNMFTGYIKNTIESLLCNLQLWKMPFPLVNID